MFLYNEFTTKACSHSAVKVPKKVQTKKLTEFLKTVAKLSGRIVVIGEANVDTIRSNTNVSHNNKADAELTFVSHIKEATRNMSSFDHILTPGLSPIQSWVLEAHIADDKIVLTTVATPPRYQSSTFTKLVVETEILAGISIKPLAFCTLDEDLK